MLSKIVSVRITITDLAKVYEIVENSGIQTRRLPMASAIRHLVELIIRNASEQELVHEYTEEAAIALLEAKLVKDAGITVKGDSRTVGKMLGSLVQPDQATAIPAGPNDETQRREIYDQMKPFIAKAKEVAEEERWAGVTTGEASTSIQEPLETVPETDLPPWNSKRVQAMALLAVQHTNPAVKEYMQAQDQVSLMAVRVVFAQVTEDVYDAEATINVIRSVAAKFHQWAEEHPESPCPASIKFKEEE